MSGRTIVILARCASLFRTGGPPRGAGTDARILALVGPWRLRRPAAIPARAGAGHGGDARLVRSPRFRRGGNRDPAGFARQRGASACLRDRTGRGWRTRAALSAHLA